MVVTLVDAEGTQVFEREAADVAAGRAQTRVLVPEMDLQIVHVTESATTHQAFIPDLPALGARGGEKTQTCKTKQHPLLSLLREAARGMQVVVRQAGQAGSRQMVVVVCLQYSSSGSGRGVEWSGSSSSS